MNQTGQIWHIAIEGLPQEFNYGFHLDKSKKTLSDPYAKHLKTGASWGEGAPLPLLAACKEDTIFDWQGDQPPLVPYEQLIIYEMHTRGFTIDPSSGVSHPGTFLGLVEKIPYLLNLGINAVELLPIFEFNECENVLKNPKTKRRLYNYWGYSTLNFFSPMARFGTIEEFKTMVRELHKHGIEIILDVVYNHTGEGSEKGHTYSYRGLANGTYYILGAGGEYMNFSGCGNTFNCNEPTTSELILASLRFWASEMHVDGFRFDLASILTRDPQGHPVHRPPIVEAISKDPLLANVKLIAEAWDAAGLYQVGSFPSFGRWSEWNGKYRDAVRQFIKGSDGVAGTFASVICGSQDLYGYERNPYHSINFVTAHDGFSLRDLVSYNQKHNESNGERNQDGTNDNCSWNCGAEGETTDPKIIALRERQMKNLHLALMISIGTPMILMGDEYGHTRHGNNNTWSHDDALNWQLWGEIEKNADFFRFYKLMIAFRKMHPVLQRTEFLAPYEIDWHGESPFKPDWSFESRFVAYTLKDRARGEDLYIAFNASHNRKTVTLPNPPEQKKWMRIIDTSLKPPFDFIETPGKHPPMPIPYKMESYSTLVSKAEGMIT
jgi:isoamylase/glycogen operon protein